MSRSRAASTDRSAIPASAFTRLAPLAVVLALAAPASAQSRKLNGALAPLPHTQGANRIFESVLGPDGDWLVYRADHDLTGNVRLFAVPADGSGPARALSSGDVNDFAIAPSGDRVSFRDPSLDLYSVSVDGSAAPVLVAAAVGACAFSPDGAELVYQASGGLMAVPSGGGTPRMIAPGVDAFAVFAISADGTRIVYRVRVHIGFLQFVAELWSVPYDGSSAPIRITPSLVRDIPDFSVSPDGTRALYRYNEFIPGTGVVDSLYSVRLDDPPVPVRIEPDAYSYEVVDSSTQVLYSARSPVSGTIELHRAPIDGGAVVRLSATPVTGENVMDFALSDDEQVAVYRLWQADVGTARLFYVPLDGSSVAAPIDQPGVASYAVTPDGDWVVFSAQEETDAHPLLYGAPLLGPAPAASLLAPSAFEGAALLDYRLGADGASVVFAARQDSWTFELFSVDVAGTLPPLRLSAPFPEGGNVDGDSSSVNVHYPVIHVDPAGRWIVYRADQVTDELVELFSVPPDAGLAPLRLNPALPASPPAGHVRSYYLDPDGEHVLFEADGGRRGIIELYRVPLAGGAPVLRLNQPLPPDTKVNERRTHLSPDGRWAVYEVVPFAGSGLPYKDLYSVDLLDTAPPVHLVGGLLPNQGLDVHVSSDSTRLAYVSSLNVHAVPLDGSEPPRQLSSFTGAGLSPLRLTPDGSRVVYSRYPMTHHNLFSAPLDGSGPQLTIGGPRVREFTPSLESFRVGHDGRVAFVADAEVFSRVELYATAADGSASQVRLSGPLVAGGDVSFFQIAGNRVVYLADEDVDGRQELYSVPSSPTPRARRADGAARRGRVKLSGAFASGNPGVGNFIVTPQQDRVVYTAQELAHPSPGLYCVEIDGSSPARRLGPALAYPWAITPDGTTVVYTSTHRLSGVYELFSVPLDGSRAPLRLTPDMPSGGDVVYTVAEPFRITPDSRQVVYLADQTVNDRVELYCVGIDGGPSVTLNGPLVAGGNVGLYANAFPAFALTLDGSEVVYLGDQERVGIFELFASPLPPP